jgi:hypothetical protein
VTLHPTGEVYARSPRALWRDTGVHVLALVPGATEERMVLLAGGAVLLWRALDQPGDLDTLTRRLLLEHVEPPHRAEVTSTVADLHSRGLVVTVPGAVT